MRTRQLTLTVLVAASVVATQDQARAELPKWLEWMGGNEATTQGGQPRGRFGTAERREFLFHRSTPKERLAQLERDTKAGSPLASALLPDRVLSNLVLESWRWRRGTYLYVAHDSSARRPTDRASKFVVIHSLQSSSRHPHLLGIPTAKQRQPTNAAGQPIDREGKPIDTNIVWLHQVKQQKAHHLGRMVRQTLGALEKLRPGEAGEAFINMPGTALTVGTLHVHAVPTRLEQRDWSRFGTKPGVEEETKHFDGDYRVYRRDGQVYVIAGRGQGAVRNISSFTDMLLGTMLLEAYKTSFGSGGDDALRGSISVVKNSDDRIVVRVERLGALFDRGGRGPDPITRHRQPPRNSGESPNISVHGPR